MKPSITMHDDTQVKVKFDYDEEAVKQIKSEIPGSGRRWRAEDKFWLVQVDFADYAVDILSSVFGDVYVAPAVMERIKAIRKHEEGK